METGDEFQLESSGGFELSCNIITGIGTVPESPGAETKLIASLADGSTGREIIGNTWLNKIYFENARQFEKSSQLSVVLRYGDKTFELAKNRKFLPVSAYVHLFGDFPLFSAAALNKPIPISGAGFSAKAAYKVTIQSDFLSNAVTVPALFSDANSLKCTLPSGIPDGSYTVNVFENDTLVKSLVSVIAGNEKEKAIGQIWVSQNDYFINSRTYYHSRKIITERGKSIYLNPFPAILGQMYAAFNPYQALPDLQLKNGRSSITIKPVVRADPSYADGSFKVYYGQYTVPIDLASDYYEARLSYPDKTESLPFWNKIEVR